MKASLRLKSTTCCMFIFTVVSACSVDVENQISCDMANREVSGVNLLENSFFDVYERCLAQLRTEAASALGQ